TFPDRDLKIDGQGGSNTLIAQLAEPSWVIRGVDSGSLSYQIDIVSTSTIQFASFQNLVGGPTSDGFFFKNGGSVSGLVDGGPGTNTLEYKDYGGNVVVNLALQSASLVNRGAANSVFHISGVVGGKGDSLIVGDADANYLVGGTGRNILIGGAGADQLTGG